MTAWRELVSRGKTLAKAERGETRFELGDLALQVAPMGEGHGRTGSMEKLTKYAEAIGVMFETLDQYRKVAAAWPEGDRSPSAHWTVHMRFAAQPDRMDLIREKDWTLAEVRELLAARRPKKLGITRNDKWWEAEKTALQQLRKWDEKRLNGLSAAEAGRRAELVAELIEIQSRIYEALTDRSYTRSL